MTVGSAAVPEAPPSWSGRIVTTKRESSGRADGAESPPAAVVGSAPTLGASVAAGAAAVLAVLVAEETSPGTTRHVGHHGVSLIA